MKEIFTAFASYNEKANAAVAALLGGMKSEPFCRDYGVYYRTIPATIVHVMESDAKWLARLKAFRASDDYAPLIARLKEGISADPGSAFAERAAILELRARMDRDIVALIEAIPSSAVPVEYEIPFGGGIMKRPLWQLLLQWFNHHTHHRGQVSAMLDIAGIEHDFSLLLDKIG